MPCIISSEQFMGKMIIFRSNEVFGIFLGGWMCVFAGISYKGYRTLFYPAAEVLEELNRFAMHPSLIWKSLRSIRLIARSYARWEKPFFKIKEHLSHSHSQHRLNIVCISLRLSSKYWNSTELMKSQQSKPQEDLW